MKTEIEYLELANQWLEKLESGKDSYSTSALESFSKIANTYLNMANKARSLGNI